MTLPMLLIRNWRANYETEDLSSFATNAAVARFIRYRSHQLGELGLARFGARFGFGPEHAACSRAA